MPSERFLKLSEEKKDRIKNAAVAELSRVSYDEISINQIVKNAEIPRGSFYEYFSDKADLVNYIMNDYKEHMIINVRNTLETNNNDLFELFREAFKFTVQFGFIKENLQFCTNIFSGLKISKCHEFETVLTHKEEMIDRFINYVNTDNLRINNREDFDCLVDILINVVRSEISFLFSDPENKEKYIKEFDKKLDFIKFGVVKPAN